MDNKAKPWNVTDRERAWMQNILNGEEVTVATVNAGYNKRNAKNLVRRAVLRSLIPSNMKQNDLRMYPISF